MLGWRGRWLGIKVLSECRIEAWCSLRQVINEKGRRRNNKMAWPLKEGNLVPGGKKIYLVRVIRELRDANTISVVHMREWAAASKRVPRNHYPRGCRQNSKVSDADRTLQKENVILDLACIACGAFSPGSLIFPPYYLSLIYCLNYYNVIMKFNFQCFQSSFVVSLSLQNALVIFT